MNPAIHARGRYGQVLFLLCIALLIWSGIGPTDRLTWFMEVVWVMLGLPLLLLSHDRFPLTRLLALLLFLHAAILMIGGHYTYSMVPIGDWLRESFGLARNHYDRLGHFAQGFVPAMIARELLIRRLGLRSGAWLFYLCVCCALSFSAFFEMIEWWAALAMGAQADAFLATQGDIWDTQWDMFLAMCGAITAQVFLQSRHDRELGLTAV